MAARARTIGSTPRPAGLDPLRAVWGLLSNVKFALVLVGLAGLAGLIAVVIPQVPGPMRSNLAARSAWLELRREDFGALTDPFDRLGLFDIYHSAWFNGLWLTVIVAVTVCTVSRFRPTWRNVQRPHREVPDSYFERAHHRASFTHPGGAEALVGALRRRRYRVEETRADGRTAYLFAERFAWSQYGTFLSHLALLLLLVGALLTRFGGYERTLVLAEGTPGAPVFDDPGPGQLFVTMLDALRGIDPAGNIVDYRSQLEVRRGDQAVRCTATVNDPCQAFGYKVHQAAFFDDIARLRVTDSAGRVVFDDVVDFDSQSNPVPVVRVTSPTGAVLFDQALPQMDTDPGPTADRGDDQAIARLTFPRSLDAAPGDVVSDWVAWRVVDGQLRVAISSQDGAPNELQAGQPITIDGYSISLLGSRNIPALRIEDLPGALTDDGATTFQMATTRTGEPYLMVTGIDVDNTVLERDRPVTTPGGFTYTFRGQVEASGVSVKRDPGDTFIWVAVGMALVGLGITFYVPRRRLWLKVTPERTHVAGVAERTTRLGRELRLLGASLGSKDALLAGDIEEP